MVNVLLTILNKIFVPFLNYVFNIKMKIKIVIDYFNLHQPLAHKGLTMKHGSARRVLFICHLV